MCGIFGTIKQDRRKVDTGILRALTMMNRERGKQALGYFDSTESIYKQAKDPIDVLANDCLTEWFDRSERESWFIVGHTRYGTRGANIDANSHPFQYGNVIGSHNGIIDAPKSYTVDSEFAIDLLDKAESCYQSALAKEWGYWTLSWYDNRKKELFLTMYDNTCGIVNYRGAWYFSSDPDHLSSALGVRDTIILKNGDTVSFDSKGRMKWRKKFESNVQYSYKKDSRTSGKKSKKSKGKSYRSYSTSVTSYGSGSNTTVYDPSDVARDYDNEFRNLWNEYASCYDN
jgi:hypothetical protein